MELSFKDAKTLAAATKLLGKDVIDTDGKEHSATISVGDTNVDIKRTLDILSQEKVTIQSMAVHKPTLDDVFLSLTGKQKKTKKTTEAEEK